MAEATWDTYLLKNKSGAYLPCLRNAVAILTHREEWLNVIAFDAFAGVIVKKKAPPWEEDIAPEDEGLGDWTREDSIRTACWIADEYGCDVKANVIEDAIRVVAQRWVVHPVRDFLNDSEKWDKKPRVDDFLIRVGGAEDSPYVRTVTKNFFISAVARIMQPGVQVDTVLILEGPQGLGKSTLLRLLASDDWFMDTIFNLGTKDGYQALRRKWIVEFSELHALTRAEVGKVKAFISSVKDTYRESYGRAATDFLRQCVFAGTVNPGSGYLNDETGARRFWPVTLTKRVDPNKVRAEREQLWAEAFFRYRSNEPWHIRDPKILEAAIRETEDRRERHPWETFFKEWLDDHKRVNKGVTTEELLTKAVGMRKDMQDRSAQTKAGNALRAIGWTLVQRGTDGTRRYFPATKHQRVEPEEEAEEPSPPKRKKTKKKAKRKVGRR